MLRDNKLVHLKLFVIAVFVFGMDSAKKTSQSAILLGLAERHCCWIIIFTQRTRLWKLQHAWPWGR